MRFRIAWAAVLILATAALGGSQQPPPSGTTTTVTVHEWGTFTSVAGPDGQAVEWMAQTGQQDLPCFVETGGWGFKGALMGTVRMETPVLYFYSPQDVSVSVDVRFPKGVMTEWYPHATVTSNWTAPSGWSSAISWPSVRVTPQAKVNFRTEAGRSHYYTARETAAAPVLVGAQPEKLLFYRGVGMLPPPLTAVANPDGSVAVRSVRGLRIGDVVFFENRRGAMAATAHTLERPDAVLPRPELEDASGAPLRELAQLLVKNGLYEKEAQAMVETWRDSWFEEGARLLYIV